MNPTVASFFSLQGWLCR